MTTLSKAEISYIRSSLLLDPPLRADGRSAEDFRVIALETGVAPLANGSARVSVGRPSPGETDGAKSTGGGTEIVVAVKLEMEDVGEEKDGDKFLCTVSWFVCSLCRSSVALIGFFGRTRSSPMAYPSLSSPALDDLQTDMTTLLSSVLSHPSLRPSNPGHGRGLVVVPGIKAWAVRVDAMVLSDAGNVVDCLFLACRAALWDTRVPRTRGVEYRAPGRNPDMAANVADEDMDVEADVDVGVEVDEKEERTAVAARSMLGTRTTTARAADFELADYWDEGEVLEAKDVWPVCVTLNVVRRAPLVVVVVVDLAAH